MQDNLSTMTIQRIKKYETPLNIYNTDKNENLTIWETDEKNDNKSLTKCISREPQTVLIIN